MVSSFRHLHSNFWYNSLSSICTCLYLIEGPIVFHSASSSKLNFRFVGRLIVNHCECHNSVIQSVIEVHELLMVQINLVSSQYHVGKASKSSRYVVAVFGGCYDIVAGMLFTLGTLAQVGECPKYVERSLKMPKNVLLHGHHLRRPARRSKSSWRPKPSRHLDCSVDEPPAHRSCQ